MRRPPFRRASVGPYRAIPKPPVELVVGDLDDDIGEWIVDVKDLNLEIYNVLRELPSGKGFADIVMIPRADAGSKPAMIIELKWDHDTDTAIRQIKEKRYAGSLSGYADRILLVGINYDKDTKKHECVIEEYRS